MTDTGVEILKEHEGRRLKPYDDATGEELIRGEKLRGNLTIGWGCNLSDGISADEAAFLLQNRIARATAMARRFDWFDNNCCPVRQDVVVMLIFNMGIGGFSGFKNLIRAIANNDWQTAAYELHNSMWAKQVQPDRVKQLTDALEKGEWS